MKKLNEEDEASFHTFFIKKMFLFKKTRSDISQRKAFL